jgi:hypothetical protein
MTLTQQICQLLKDGKPRTARLLADELGVDDVTKIRKALLNTKRNGRVTVHTPEAHYSITPSAVLRMDADTLEKAEHRAKEAARKKKACAEQQAREAIKRANDRLRTEEQLEKVERNRLRYQAKTQIRDAVAGKVANSVFAWGGANA